MNNLIAKTILQQIGGHRFAAMTGSHDFINLGNGLRMSLSRNKTSANRLEIIYDEGADLYNVRFYRQSMNHKTFEVTTKWKNRSRLGQCAGADWDTFDDAKLVIFSETIAF